MSKYFKDEIRAQTCIIIYNPKSADASFSIINDEESLKEAGDSKRTMKKKINLLSEQVVIGFVLMDYWLQLSSCPYESHTEGVWHEWMIDTLTDKHKPAAQKPYLQLIPSFNPLMQFTAYCITKWNKMVNKGNLMPQAHRPISHSSTQTEWVHCRCSGVK